MKYYLKLAGIDMEWREVTKDEYIRTEQNAGFHSKFGRDYIATASFGTGTVEGKVEYEEGIDY